MTHWEVITNVALNEKAKDRRVYIFRISSTLRKYTYRNSKGNLPK